jgi:lipoprotein NlpD
MFFCTTAHSEKKNSVYGENADREVNFYNKKYKKKAAESNRDIISYNSNPRIGYKDSSEKKEYSRPVNKKESNVSTSLNKKNSAQTSADETVWYIVKSGDTLYGIAKRSGVSLKCILDMNNLREKSKIYKGMKLRVPTKNRSGKISSASKEKNTVSSKPLFQWPLKKVKGYSSDGKDGVKSIGILIKGNPGGDVVASDDGIVKRVGYMRGYGKYIVVKHDNRYITVYSNLMDVDVKAGDTVQRGVRIGNISDDMTLHFQIDRAGKPENPVRLLPRRS